MKVSLMLTGPSVLHTDGHKKELSNSLMESSEVELLINFVF